MKKLPDLKILLSILLVCGLTSMPASARNTLHKFPIGSAIEAAKGAKAKSQMKPEVRLFWGNQSYPKAAQTYGTYTANKKTNSFNKSDQEACNWAWLSAVLSLQNRAIKEGGNAVVNIKSYYKGKEFVSNSEFECGAGAFVTGVALRGTVVKLP